jgi:hypothetical protein
LAVGLMIIETCLFCGDLTSLSAVILCNILHISPSPPLADRCLDRLRDGNALSALGYLTNFVR